MNCQVLGEQRPRAECDMKKKTKAKIAGILMRSFHLNVFWNLILICPNTSISYLHFDYCIWDHVQRSKIIQSTKFDDGNTFESRHKYTKWIFVAVWRQIATDQHVWHWIVCILNYVLLEMSREKNKERFINPTEELHQ